MGIEVWSEKHQFVLWAAGIGVTTVVALFSRELRAWLDAAPGGLLKARDAYRATSLNRLERYLNEPGMQLREIVAYCSIMMVFGGLMGVVNMDRFLKGGLLVHRPTDETAIVSLADHVVTYEAVIVIAAYTLVLGMVYIGFIALVIVWKYRDPKYRIVRLRSLLEQSENANHDSETET
jgi:hypothetical protein